MNMEKTSKVRFPGGATWHTSVEDKIIRVSLGGSGGVSFTREELDQFIRALECMRQLLPSDVKVADYTDMREVHCLNPTY